MGTTSTGIGHNFAGRKQAICGASVPSLSDTARLGFAVSADSFRFGQVPPSFDGLGQVPGSVDHSHRRECAQVHARGGV